MESGKETCSVRLLMSGRLGFLLGRRIPLDPCGSPSRLFGFSGNAGGGNSSSKFSEVFLLLGDGGETGVLDTTGGFSKFSGARTDGTSYWFGTD